MLQNFLTLSEKIIPAARSGRMVLSGLSGVSASMGAARLAAAETRDVLLVAPDSGAAQTLLHDLQFFLPLLTDERSPPELLPFPSWEISPYSRLSPIVGNRMQRLQCLHFLAKKDRARAIIVASVQALGQPTLSPANFRESLLRLETGASRDPASLVASLLALGYSSSDPVEDPGTFTLRGGILDVYSAGYAWPLRLEFFGDEIEKMRFFHPDTQRGLAEELPPAIVDLCPLREISLKPEGIERARTEIRAWCDSHDLPRTSRERMLAQLAEGIVTTEMDFLLPFFNADEAFLWDHFDQGVASIWVDEGKCREEASAYERKLREGYEKCIAQESVAAPPEKLFVGAERISAALPEPRRHGVEPLDLLGKGQSLALRTNANPKFLDNVAGKKAKSAANLERLHEFLAELLSRDFLIFFAANSQAQLDRMAFLLAQKGLRSTMVARGVVPKEPPGRGMVVLIDGRLSAGFQIEEEKICFLTEDEIFGAKKHRETNRHQPQKSMAKAVAQTSLDDLQVGEYLVHMDHGVGRYRGLVKLSPDGVPGDYVFIEYAAGDKLYLPIYRLDAIQKYVGAAGGHPALERLGSQVFTKAKERARSAVKDIAAGLLEIYARRAASQGYAFPEPDENYRAFEAAFPYDETPDQLKAIQETIADMCSDKPMDRLVCGDVGYGKTEVAMRAACLAVTDAKQVAVLVPTTVLAEQHLQSFRNRFAGTPFRIESLSRFRSKKEQSETIAALKEGKIDIVIGTHRLLSRDVEFRDLGLMIVDEEQRFGVEHKEKLKKIRATTDVLTLTATPIPRTLHFAMLGIRDITIIQTPPADRLAIRTYVAEFNEEIIREALETEMKRGGQAFFIHNRVQSMPTIFRQLGELMPKLKIGVAHGQMPETELERVMVDFYQKKFDLLLCTAIIENGLDVPSANTIIVNRADTFGLSQLYQIRGRVGRSQARAYAYLLLPNDAPVTDEAKERLQVLQRHVELGSGFMISSHDLELRGAGDILGDSQSGHVTAIGYDLYLEMLAEEIARLRGEEPEDRTEIEISSPFPAYLPEGYVPDPKSRLSLYKRFTSFTSEEEIEEGKKELVDRYGPMPGEAEGLLWLLKIKLLLARFGFKSLRISKTKLALEADKNPKVEIPRLLDLIRKRPREFSFGSDSKLVVQKGLSSWGEAHTVLRDLILTLAAP